MSSKSPDAVLNDLIDTVHGATRCYCRRLERCRKKFSEKRIHALRIEIRRVLALLDLIERLHLVKPPLKCRKNFKKLLDDLDPLRDAQVQWDLLKPLWAVFPEAKSFKRLLSRREKSLRARLRHKIRRAKLTRQTRTLEELEEQLCRCAKQISGAENERRILIALRSHFYRVAQSRRLVRGSNPASIHRLRVAFKRFRYACELVKSFLPGTRPLLARMKSYQNAAGQVQDFVVLLDRMNKCVVRGELSKRALEKLRRELLRRQRQAVESFMDRIDDLFEFAPAAAGLSRRTTEGHIQK